MSREYQLYGTTLGQCCDHDWAMFDTALLQTNLSLETLNTETNRSKGHVKGVLSLWVHKRAVFGYELPMLAELCTGFK